MAAGFEIVKYGFAKLVSANAEFWHPPSEAYLATDSLPAKTERVLRERLDQLNPGQKNQVYGKVWELAKMLDPRIDGNTWGEIHAFDNLDRLTKALHRTGFLGNGHLHPLKCLPFEFGEGGIGSQYYSLGEKIGRDPAGGYIGYVNGMGCVSLGAAGGDASQFSERFAQGYNLHCVYHSTHQTAPQWDVRGFIEDVLRMQAVNGGSYTKTSCLIVQQWIDFLNANPEKKFLQIGISEGTAHVNAALRILSEARPELIPRVRVINFCPAYFILPSDYPGLQVINFVKIEDEVINPWGTHTDMISHTDAIKIVPHTHDHPHHHNNMDFATEAIPYIHRFIANGDLEDGAHLDHLRAQDRSFLHSELELVDVQ